MSLSAISLYNSPLGTVCSSEFDPSCRGSLPCTTTVPLPPATSHRLSAVTGGLSCLFSSQAAAAALPRAPTHDELGSLWHDGSDDLSFGGGYSHSPSPLKRRDMHHHHHHHHNPVSVFQGPSSSPASRSPPASWLTGRERDHLFSGFVRHALDSCIDYVPATRPRSEVSGASLHLSSTRTSRRRAPPTSPTPENSLSVPRPATASSMMSSS